MNRFPALDTVWLEGLSFTAHGLQSLKPLPRLTAFGLPNGLVDDQAAMAIAQKMPNLKILDLTGNRKLSPAAAEHLATLESMWFLNLDSTEIDDAALLKLASLPRLERLSVRSTDVTAEGQAAFHSARASGNLPPCKVEF